MTRKKRPAPVVCPKCGKDNICARITIQMATGTSTETLECLDCHHKGAAEEFEKAARRDVRAGR